MKSLITIADIDQWGEDYTRFVDRMVKKHALNCGVPEVEKWARGWLDGTDRSAEAVIAAEQQIVKMIEQEQNR